MAISSETEIQEFLAKIASDINEIKISQVRIETRLDALEARIDTLEKNTEQRFISLENQFNQKFVSLENQFNQRLVSLETQVNRQDNRFWAFLLLMGSSLLGILAKLVFFPSSPIA